MVHCVIALKDWWRVRKLLCNYVSTAENSYAGEKSYKTGLPLSYKFEEQNVYFK